MRTAARRPGFLAAVLDYFAGHEPDLLAFASASGIDPARIAAAHAALSSSDTVSKASSGDAPEASGGDAAPEK